MDVFKLPCNKMGRLLNWETDACILAPGWNISSQRRHLFALSCLCVVALAIFLEFLRMTLRRHDEYLIRKHILNKPQRPRPPPGSAASAEAEEAAYAAALAAVRGTNNNVNNNGKEESSHGHQHNHTTHPGAQHPVIEDPAPLERVRYRPSFFEQFVRAFIFTLMVTNAYLLVLLAVSFNGFVLASILLGSFCGFIGFQWGYLQG